MKRIPHMLFPTSYWTFFIWTSLPSNKLSMSNTELSVSYQHLSKLLFPPKSAFPQVLNPRNNFDSTIIFPLISYCMPSPAYFILENLFQTHLSFDSYSRHLCLYPIFYHLISLLFVSAL